MLDLQKNKNEVSKNLELLKSLEVERKNSNSVKSKQGYIELMHRFEYCYFVTFTIKYDLTMLQDIKHLNKLIGYMNERIFGKTYLKKGSQYLDGFVVVEYHKSGRAHYHMIIKNDPRIDMDGHPNFTETLNNLSKKITFKKGRFGVRVFGHRSIVVREVYDGNIIDYKDIDGIEQDGDLVGYVTKEIWKSNGSTVFPLSREGILYTDLDIGYH